MVLYDPYPEETESFNCLPKECPVHFLDYGLLSEKIQPLVQKNRQRVREERLCFLVKKLSVSNLIQCMSPFIPESDRGLQAIRSGLLAMVNNYKVPLIYLEEMYQKQVTNTLHDFKIGDWVCVDKQSWWPDHHGVFVSDNKFGIVREIKGKTAIRLMVDLVGTGGGVGVHQRYPVFNRMAVTYQRTVCPVTSFSIWVCRTIGKDTVGWVALREKMAKDDQTKTERKEWLWKHKIQPFIPAAPGCLCGRGCSGIAAWSYNSNNQFRNLWMNPQLNTLSRDFWKGIVNHADISSFHCPNFVAPVLVSDPYFSCRRDVILCMRRFILDNNILENVDN